MLAKLFRKDPPSHRPEPAGKDQPQRTAPLKEFTVWLVEAGETDAIIRKQLWLLYGEFCLDTNTGQLTLGQLFRRLRAAGIDRYRESVGRRRWFYRVRSADVVDISRWRLVA